ncbi:winged helix-turn-helix domain-containing protein [Algoriphagus sp. NF]|uniref:winged helix-turn-helix domain-containing protein n=1 Tax=Algoriphagus sp. NF TaxID=2992756 RepID=UPI00237C09BC|nr:winged helix-turn-helix domain-containing protein [Algoriphagus sp. NF]MDE0558540.1 winged helix-turn-helix domain-containing protein [Algoriphagus sp. NF]
MLDSLVTSKTRIKLLLKFFSHANSGYLRSLAKEFDESTNSVRVELNRLADAGLLVAKDEGKTKMYKANEGHPFFQEIKNMVSKFLGLDDLMERIVKRMGEVEKAYIVGDYAQGIDSGTVQMILIGKNLDRDYLDFIREKTYEKVSRKVEVEILESDPGDIQGILIFGK